MNEANERNKMIIDEFQANGGKVGGRFEGRTLLLLHTKGAKSGQERINPVACIKDGDRLAVIASKGGTSTHPDWYYNVVANPQVTVEVGTENACCRIIFNPDVCKSDLEKYEFCVKEFLQ